MLLEEINQKILQKEKRFKKYQSRINQYKTGHSKKNERKFYQLVDGECRKAHQELDAKETTQLWRKI